MDTDRAGKILENGLTKKAFADMMGLSLVRRGWRSV